MELHFFYFCNLQGYPGVLNYCVITSRLKKNPFNTFFFFLTTSRLILVYLYMHTCAYTYTKTQNLCCLWFTYFFCFPFFLFLLAVNNHHQRKPGDKGEDMRLWNILWVLFLLVFSFLHSVWYWVMPRSVVSFLESCIFFLIICLSFAK